MGLINQSIIATKMNCYIASDHAGFNLKETIIREFASRLPDPAFIDLGTSSSESCHYPLFAKALCEKVLQEKSSFGILICGSGIGMSMAANKFKGVRAALCKSAEEARLARAHNHANVLCLGAKVLSLEENKNIVEAFFKASEESGRHTLRVEMMDKWGEVL